MYLFFQEFISILNLFSIVFIKTTLYISESIHHHILFHKKYPFIMNKWRWITEMRNMVGYLRTDVEYIEYKQTLLGISNLENKQTLVGYWISTHSLESSVWIELCWLTWFPLQHWQGGWCGTKRGFKNDAKFLTWNMKIVYNMFKSFFLIKIS